MKQKDDNLNRKRCLLVVSFICIMALSLKAQHEIKNYPVQFNQYIFSYPLINPASLGVYSSNELTLGYQKPITGFTGVSTYFCSFSYQPYQPKSGSNNKSIIGIRLFNDREGAYINRTRFYGMYAFHTHITRNLNFAGGIDFGGMNFSIKSTPTTSGASSFTVDANSGIWLYNNNFHVGFSVNQLFNSKLQPLDEITSLPVHFNISASKTLISNTFLQIVPHILVTFPYYTKTSIRSSLYCLFFKKIISVVGWNYEKEISALIGIHEIPIYKNLMDIMVSYSSSIKQESLGINIIELSIIYDFNNKKHR